MKRMELLLVSINAVNIRGTAWIAGLACMVKADAIKAVITRVTL